MGMSGRELLRKFSKKELKKVESGEHTLHFEQGVQCITVPLDHYSKLLDELNQRRKR